MVEKTTRSQALASRCSAIFLVSIILALTAGSSVAQAKLAHYYDAAASAAFGERQHAYQVAVDEVNDYLYIVLADSSEPRVERLTTSGAPAPFSSLGVNTITKTGPGNGPSAEGFGDPLRAIVVDPVGNFYVSDPGHQVVNKFAPSGTFIRAIGADIAPNAPGVTVPNTPVGSFYPTALALSKDGTALYVGDGANGGVDLFDPSTGAFLAQPVNGSDLQYTLGLAVDGTGQIFASNGVSANAMRFDAEGKCLAICPFDPGVTYAIAIDLSSEAVYLQKGFEEKTTVYSTSGTKLDEFGSGLGIVSQGIAVGAASGTIYLPDPNQKAIEVFRKFQLPTAATTIAKDVTDTSATITAHLEPDGGGPITECRFEYGQTDAYEFGQVPCDPPASPASPLVATADVSAAITSLQPATTYHYRVVATNGTGEAVGFETKAEDKTFLTSRGPTIESFSASDLTPKSAVLHAQINPHGGETRYRFEYGRTTGYGRVTPVPDAVISASEDPEDVSMQLTDLEVGAAYHFRVIAENPFGQVVTGDQTFSFFTPNCPNALVRQETSANTLPDCRAYELVSPADAGGASLYPSGPTSPTAVDPSRFAYSGTFGAIPGSGEPVNTISDLYVATRTQTGWTSRYVGLPGNEVSLMGEAPPYPGFNNSDESIYSQSTLPGRLQRGVLTNPDMSRFVSWDNGNSLYRFFRGGFVKTGNGNALPSKAPYVWNSDGEQLDRWPTNLASVPGGLARNSGTEPANPLDDYRGFAGDVTASDDLQHFFFSSREIAYVPSASPGSAYDNEVGSGELEVISKAPDGSDLARVGFVRFPRPASSANGSHVLMSPEGNWTYAGATPPPTRLYMRVNKAITFDVSRGASVRYVGMTSDGSSVYFVSAENLTSDDHDTSADIFRWDEATDSLTRLSKGTNGTGDTDSCSTSWVAGCGVETYTGNPTMCELHGGLGGNCHSDNSIAASAGGVYFLSPERLKNLRGVNGQANLYRFSDGQLQFVATFEPDDFCVIQHSFSGGRACSDGPIIRMQVTPDDTRVAFITASRLTSYDNAGHLEMYTWDPPTEKLMCVSCIPSGVSPANDVFGSQNGRFLTDDGRPFFSTRDALVPQDTNEIRDVYEFVDGRPQLITTGTGALDIPEISASPVAGLPGLVGVSANGTDVYFTTFDVLVGQDRNGNQLKVYDARVGGGFPFTPPPPRCVAADECHGPSSQVPNAPLTGTAVILGKDGNLTPKASKKSKARAKKGKHRKKKQQKSRKKDRHHG